MFEEYNKAQKAVFETTLRLINEKELQATSMSLISKESGVSTGAIYHYFDSKEAIINELYIALIKASTKAVLKNFDVDETLQIRFGNAWRNLIEFAIQQPDAFRFMEQYSFSPYIEKTTKVNAEEINWCRTLATLYESAVKADLFIDWNPQLMVQMHYGSVVYLLKAYFQDNMQITEKEVNKMIDYCWNSVHKASA